MKQLKKPDLSSAKERVRSAPTAAAAIAVGAAVFCFTAWYSFFPKPPLFTVNETGGISDDSAVSEALAAMSLARSNLRSEHYAAKLTGKGYSYFPHRSGIYDFAGGLCYDSTTAVNEISSVSSARSRAMLCRYLYGDVNAGGLEGYLRYDKGTGEGCDVTLTLRPQLEESIYMLLKYNGILGGCIIQDVETGEIQTMCATSTTGIDREVSGCTQFEANISAAVFDKLSITAEEASSAFDCRSSYSQEYDDEKGEMISSYGFMTDFGMLTEPAAEDGKPVPKAEALAKPLAEGYISPLHLCSTVQRIWSGKHSVPVLTASVKDAEGNPVTLPAYTAEELPQELCERARGLFTPVAGMETDMRTIKNTGDGVKYTAGIITPPGRKSKAFVLYSQEDARINLLAPCIAYFIEHSEEVN